MTESEQSSRIIITLPFPPTVNTYYRHVGSRVLISKKGRKYREAVFSQLFGDRRKSITGRMAVVIEVYPPNRLRRDLDNLLKSLLDAMTHAKVWNDDSQIDDLRIIRKEVAPGGLVLVGITIIKESK